MDENEGAIMLTIKTSGVVYVDDTMVGGLHLCEDTWVFQSCRRGGIVHSDDVRDNVIDWLLHIMDDGVVAL